MSRSPAPGTPPSTGGWKGKRYEAVKTSKDVYKMGRYDVVTTQLHGKEVVKPDVVAGISYYRGIDEELAEAEAEAKAVTSVESEADAAMSA